VSTKKISLADIAQSLGVSKSTVSFVLNDKGDFYNISPETQRLIREKAKELNYVPNFFAKGLREGKTKTVGLILPDISNNFYADLCKTIQTELFTHGYNVFIVNTNDDKTLEIELLGELINRSIDGLILVPCNEVIALQPLLDNTPIPVVFMDRIGDEFGDFVGINNENEAALVVERFSTLPSKLLIVHDDEVSSIKSRLAGAVKAAESNKIQYKVLHHSAVKLADLKDADSVLGLNIKSTLVCLQLAKENGLSIPQDFKLISFDDSCFFSYFSPTISALEQPVKKIGKQTVDQLMNRILVEKSRGNHILLPCIFNERESH
jgi:LacI family transcriptional regulator